LKYNEITGEFTREKSICGKVKVGDVAGYKSTSGYVSIRVLSKKYYAHRLAWLYSYGEWPICEIDHVDRVKDNNSLVNLRSCDKFQNQCNTTSKKNSIYKSKGVDFMKSKSRFRARITIRGKAIHLGLFHTELEASQCYEMSAIKHQEGYGTTRSSSEKNHRLTGKQ